MESVSVAVMLAATREGMRPLPQTRKATTGTGGRWGGGETRRRDAAAREKRRGTLVKEEGSRTKDAEGSGLMNDVTIWVVLDCFATWLNCDSWMLHLP